MGGGGDPGCGVHAEPKSHEGQSCENSKRKEFVEGELRRRRGLTLDES